MWDFSFTEFFFNSMDKSAVGHEHIEKVEKHASQKDYTTGFGGKFGVQSDRVDKVRSIFILLTW